MYLYEAESSQYGETILIADTHDVVSDLRDFEFNEARVRPPMLSPRLVRESTRAMRRFSIFLDEFHKGAPTQTGLLEFCMNWWTRSTRSTIRATSDFVRPLTCCGLSSSVSSAAHSIGVWKKSAPSLKLRMAQDEPESTVNLSATRRPKSHGFVNLPERRFLSTIQLWPIETPATFVDSSVYTEVMPSTHRASAYL